MIRRAAETTAAAMIWAVLAAPVILWPFAAWIIPGWAS
jgi:hypothetical protein